MYYTIKNDKITVQISSLGAELMSIVKDGVEYVWQGDPTYWRGRACNLFPVCGRMIDGKYTYKGEIYEMIIHGFSRLNECEVYEQSEDRIVFTLEDNEETYKSYPFKFKFFAEFALNGDTLTVKYTATNTDNKVMYATFGGHPGFNVPLDNGSFEDYYLEFSEKCEPREIIFSDGSTVPFPIRDNQFIDLKHSLFDNDSIFMVNAADAMTLKSKISERSVTISYPGAKYMGIWHTPKSDAPFVCLEPWWGSPARAGGYADLETMQDLYAFQPGDTKSVAYDIIIK